jgi:hypothetical protein
VKTHVQVVAALNIAAGAIYVAIAAVIFLFVGGTGGIVAAQGELRAAGILTVVTFAICGLLTLIALPSIIAGWGLFAGKNWARPVTLVLAIFHLPNFPFGTALGVYSLWVLLQPDADLHSSAPAVQAAS